MLDFFYALFVLVFCHMEFMAEAQGLWQAFTRVLFLENATKMNGNANSLYLFMIYKYFRLAWIKQTTLIEHV